MLVLDWGWTEIIASKTSHLLAASSHFHLETTVCTATKESIVARLQWSYQISAACHALRHFYILFLTTIYDKCKLAQCVRFLCSTERRWECNLRWVRDPANFFFLFFFTLRRVLYLFINHKTYNFLDCDWFKKLLFSTYSSQVVIGQLVIGQFNKPITFKVVV